MARAAAAAARAARIVVPGFIGSSRRRRGCDARMSLRKRSPSPAKVTLNERGLGAVYWFMPQLIDYARFLLALPLVLLLPPASVPQAAGTRLACVVSYVFSHLLDFVDGRVARAYDQCSHFGILLDHTLDIMTTAFMWAELAGGNLPPPRFDMCGVAAATVRRLATGGAPQTMPQPPSYM